MDMKTVLIVLARILLVSLGGALAQHGIIQASGVEQFVSIGVSIVLILGSASWSIWEKYVQPVLVAKLEAWKLQALASADALKKAGLAVPPPPTAAQVDAATPSSVTPAVAAQAVAEVATKIILLAVMVMGMSAFLSMPAGAQGVSKAIQNIARQNDANPVSGQPPSARSVDKAFDDFHEQVKALVKEKVDEAIDDLNAAITDATNRGDDISLPCWQANLAFAQLLPSQWKDPPKKIGLALAIQIKRDLINQILGSQKGSIKVSCSALWGDEAKILVNIASLFGLKIALGSFGL